MATRLTWSQEVGEIRHEAALCLTPDFSGQLASLWATWLFLNFPLFFMASSLYSSLLCLCPQPPCQNVAEQQTQIVAINFRLVYGMDLVAHLLVNPCNRHCCPLLSEQKTTRPQLHPAAPFNTSPCLIPTSPRLSLKHFISFRFIHLPPYSCLRKANTNIYWSCMDI